MRLLSLSTFYKFVITLATISLVCNAKSFQDQFLEPHNVARSKVQVAPLVWNNTLASFARNYANKIKATCDDTLGSGGPYGENTAGGYDAGTIEQAVGNWVGEKMNYNHPSNTCKQGMECKHYTQVVWRNTKSIGCASILCGAGWPFIVCEYYPRGNIKGQSPY